MMVLADIATTVAAGLAAVAAAAAWATVTTEWWRQRKARQPNISAGFLDIRSVGQKIEFVNMGPGLAIQLGYLLFVGGLGGQRVGAIVGTGHLQAGERETVDLRVQVPGKAAAFVWVCRDIDQRLHIWSYDGRHERLRKGDYPKLGEAFSRMYPNIALPPRNVGMPEDPTAPGETLPQADKGEDS